MTPMRPLAPLVTLMRISLICRLSPGPGRLPGPVGENIYTVVAAAGSTEMDVPRYHTALIVGAGPGLSASLARLCGKNGMNIALAARRVEKLAELCADTGASAHAC